MSRKVLDSRHSIDSCTFQLHAWKPFHHHCNNSLSSAKSLDSPPTTITTKRPCRSDRATAIAGEAIDLSRLSIADDRCPYATARKRRRRGSRSVSGRSSDRARCCSVGASAACSDFPLAVGTDSSGELFLSSNGDGNWSSDVSDARNPRRENKECFSGVAPIGSFDPQAVDSGYGSEPGYRGDAEFGYGDEEDDDGRLLFWGHSIEDIDSAMEIVGENTFSDQKSHHRCRRKKHDIRMVDSVT